MPNIMFYHASEYPNLTSWYQGIIVGIIVVLLCFFILTGLEIIWRGLYKLLHVIQFCFTIYQVVAGLPLCVHTAQSMFAVSHVDLDIGTRCSVGCIKNIAVALTFKHCNQIKMSVNIDLQNKTEWLMCQCSRVYFEIGMTRA